MTRPTRRAASLALAAALLAAGSAFAQQQVLNVYNWAEYIAPDTLANFEKETGIKVRYDNFDTNEVLHAKLVAGRTGYDIVVPGAHFAKQQIDAGLLQPLDRSKLKNWGNLDPALLEQLAKVDPGNKYLVTWMWGYVAVGINTAKVKAALGDLPMPANAWDLVFDPKVAGRLKGCGLSMLDSASEMIPVALHYVGKPPFSRVTADYDAAAAMLKKVRPSVTRFSSSGYIADLANGSLCAVVGYSGDINIARARAIEGRTGQDIVALVPSGGSMIFFDTMAIPKDARNVDAAHRFIDYILRPEVHASLTNTVFFANPNSASLPHVKPEIANNKTIFLPPEDLKKMFVSETLPQDMRRVQTRVFTSFRAGR